MTDAMLTVASDSIIWLMICVFVCVVMVLLACKSESREHVSSLLRGVNVSVALVKFNDLNDILDPSGKCFALVKVASKAVTLSRLAPNSSAPFSFAWLRLALVRLA